MVKIDLIGFSHRNHLYPPVLINEVIGDGDGDVAMAVELDNGEDEEEEDGDEE